jgi:hypothetical protein
VSPIDPPPPALAPDRNTSVFSGISVRDTGFRESIALLWTRRFGTFWFASLLSNIGTWAQQVAEP